jgi:hypothetical protein
MNCWSGVVRIGSVPVGAKKAPAGVLRFCAPETGGVSLTTQAMQVQYCEKYVARQKPQSGKRFSDCASAQAPIRLFVHTTLTNFCFKASRHGGTIAACAAF